VVWAISDSFVNWKILQGPEILVSFVSSVFDSCRLIFDDQLKLISFRLELQDSERRKYVESVYNSYESLINENFIVETDY
jgi:hypothetical protein